MESFSHFYSVSQIFIYAYVLDGPQGACVPLPSGGTLMDTVCINDANLVLYLSQYAGCITCDSDEDGVPDLNDCAWTDPTRWFNFAWPDPDGDGVRNQEQAEEVECYGIDVPMGYTDQLSDLDNCPAVYNPNQLDSDEDGQGNACDADDDNDGVVDVEDCAPIDGTRWRNRAYPDADNDGIRNSTELETIACFGAVVPVDYTLATNGPDNCPANANPDQLDSDGDGQGDLCDQDNDNDGVTNLEDCAPLDSSRWRNRAYPDPDFDQVRNSANLQTVDCFGEDAPAGWILEETAIDNCAVVPNPAQNDHDDDGIGDACDPDLDADHDGVADLVDCAPQDPARWRNTAYPDADGDRISNTNTPITVVCYGGDAPPDMRHSRTVLITVLRSVILNRLTLTAMG